MSQRTDRRRERYSRNLEGWNAQGFFASTAVTTFTTDATLAEFLANAAEAEIGLYSKDGGTLFTTAPAAGSEVMWVQKQNGLVKRSQPISWDNLAKVIKTDYDAPVIQVTTIGYNGTSGSMNTSIVGGLQEFVASARETTPANQPFPVTEGRSIVRSGTPSDYDIANDIVSDIQAEKDYERNADDNFVIADIIYDATGTAITSGTVGVLHGSPTVTTSVDMTTDFIVGDYAIIDGSVYQVLASSATQITLDRNYAGASDGALSSTSVLSDVAADVEAAEVGIRFTGRDELVHFTASRSEDLADATLTTTSSWKQGSGAAWQVASMEDETQVMDGYTTINEAWTRDFGQPACFVDDSSADQYALYFATYNNSIIPSAGTPQNQTLLQTNIIHGAIEGSDLETKLDAIYGV